MSMLSRPAGNSPRPQVSYQMSSEVLLNCLVSAQGTGAAGRAQHQCAPGPDQLSPYRSLIALGF